MGAVRFIVVASVWMAIGVVLMFTIPDVGVVTGWIITALYASPVLLYYIHRIQTKRRFGY
jgi:uncharacterized membrane protein